MSKLCGILPISVVFFSDFDLATINGNCYFVFKILVSYREKNNVLVIEKKLLRFEAVGQEFENFKLRIVLSFQNIRLIDICSI